MLPIECVVRGYLSGSGWKDYRSSGEVCGHRLPAGLVESQRLPEPIFTPATKAQTGHDENIDREAAAALVGAERFAEVERTALELYAFASEHALQRGIILADTKLEFGLDPDGRLVLGDEAFTPDSSRFWPADDYEPGFAPPSFDKQFVRDFPRSLRLGQDVSGPELPPTSSRAPAPVTSRRSPPSPASTSTRIRRPGGRPRMGVTVLVPRNRASLDPQGQAVGTPLRDLGLQLATRVKPDRRRARHRRCGGARRLR
jgi:hypothetical protein